MHNYNFEINRYNDASCCTDYTFSLRLLDCRRAYISLDLEDMIADISFEDLNKDLSKLLNLAERVCQHSEVYFETEHFDLDSITLCVSLDNPSVRFSFEDITYNREDVSETLKHALQHLRDYVEFRYDLEEYKDTDDSDWEGGDC